MVKAIPTLVKKSTVPPAPAPLDAELHLMGATRLGAFVDCVRQRAVGGMAIDECATADLWRNAARHYETLQMSEPGAADKPIILPVPKSMQAHIAKLTQLETFAATFSSVPIAFGMVPLAQLVCSQFDITVSTLEALKNSRPKTPNAQALASLCLPLAPKHGNCVLGKQGGGEYIFHSDSHDLRFLGSTLVPVANIAGYHPNGHAQAAVVLGIGFSTNVLNVVRYSDRLVLNNGYHRALALLSQGISHAPCVVQVCSHWEDVGMAAMDEIFDNGSVYFSKSRPPMLRDYLNPALTSTWPIRKVRRQISIKYTNTSVDITQN